MAASRDPAVDGILTGETLLAQFHALIPRLGSLLPADVSLAIGEAQSLYPELWAALDRARGVLRDRGVAVPAFDDLRARQPAAMLGAHVHTREQSPLSDGAAMTAFLVGGVAGLTVASVGAKTAEVNRGGLSDARRALEALRAAMPDVDWKTVRRHEAREVAVALDDLSNARMKKLLVGLAGLAVVALLAVGLVVILQRSSPEAAKEKDEEEFRAAQEEIRELNAVLHDSPCDAVAAERRASLFKAHDRGATARRLAKKFLAECGETPALRAIADGP